MEEVLQANVFFFITGIAVIIFSALLCVALFHFIKVLKTLRRITERIDQGTESLAEDVEHFKTFFFEGGLIGSIISKIVGSAYKNKNKKTTGKTVLKIKEDD